MIMQSNPNGSHGSVLGPLWSIHFGVSYWMCVCLFRRTEFIDLFFGGGPESAPKLSVSRFRIRSILPNLPNFDWILGSLSAFRGIPRSAAFPQELTQKLEDLNTAATEKLHKLADTSEARDWTPESQESVVFQDVFGACLAPRKDRKAVNIMPYRPPWGLGIKSGWHELWEVWWHLGAGIAVVYWCLLVIVTPKQLGIYRCFGVES